MRYLGGVLVIILALIISAGVSAPDGRDDTASTTQPGGGVPFDPPLIDVDVETGSDPSDDAAESQSSDTELNEVPDDERCFPAEADQESSIAGTTIIIDPGHGGEDLGTVNTQFDLMESDLVLSISGILRDRLTQSGANACLTRIRDRNLSLRDRAELANRWQGDAFVSIHLNRLPDPTENYTMTMWNTEDKDLELADVLLGVVSDELSAPGAYNGEPNPMSSEVVRIDHLDSSMLRTARMPAVLVEAAFLSNTWEARAFLDGIEDGTRWRERQIADAVHEGLLEYFSEME